MRSYYGAKFLFLCGVALGSYLVYNILLFKNDTAEAVNCSQEMYIKNAEIKSLDAKKNTSTLKADTLRQYNGVISADKVTAEIASSSGTVKLTSTTANGTKEKCQLIKGVEVDFGENGVLKTQEADVDILQKKINMPLDVKLKNNSTQISSASCNADLEKREIHFDGNVDILHEKIRANCNSLLVYYSGDLKDKAQKFDFKNAVLKKNILAITDGYRIFVRDTIKIQDKLITASGDVRVVGNKNGKRFNLKTNELSIVLDDKKQLDKIVCKTDFVLKIEDNTIIGRDGYFYKNKVVINQNVHIISTNGEMIGKSGVYDLNNNKAEIKEPSGVFFKR